MVSPLNFNWSESSTMDVVLPDKDTFYLYKNDEYIVLIYGGTFKNCSLYGPPKKYKYLDWSAASVHHEHQCISKFFFVNTPIYQQVHQQVKLISRISASAWLNHQQDWRISRIGASAASALQHISSISNISASAASADQQHQRSCDDL